MRCRRRRGRRQPRRPVSSTMHQPPPLTRRRRRRLQLHFVCVLCTATFRLERTCACQAMCVVATALSSILPSHSANKPARHVDRHAARPPTRFYLFALPHSPSAKTEWREARRQGQEERTRCSFRLRTQKGVNSNLMRARGSRIAFHCNVSVTGVSMQYYT